MRGIDDLHVLAFGQSPQRTAYLFDAVTEILPAMPGDQDQLLARIEEREPAFQPGLERCIVFDPIHYLQQRVDHRVAGHMHARGIDAFREQVRP